MEGPTLHEYLAVTAFTNCELKEGFIEFDDPMGITRRQYNFIDPFFFMAMSCEAPDHVATTFAEWMGPFDVKYFAEVTAFLN